MAPSKPQNFIANFSGTHPILTWSANKETDISGYRVYKKLTTACCGIKTTYVYTTATSFTDNDFTIVGPRFAKDKAEYWIVAIDNDNNLSVETDDYNTIGNSSIAWKTISVENDNNLNEFKLFRNYPNPFNPITRIEYQIPKESQVTIKVYNTLGKEIATLVDERLSVGKYYVDFDGSNLSSGIYIYSIRANDFIQNQKMALLK